MDYIRHRKHAAGSVDPSLAAATAALAACLALPAHAQSSDHPRKALKDVVVSADDIQDQGYKADVSANPKATAPLLDTPQTVTVIKEQLFQEQAATTLTEALQNSPGVGTFFLGENGSTNTGDSVYMRGADVSGSIFVDGVRDVGSVSRDVFNVEQVEVLKGAAGADVGRGAATGAINLITKQPTLRAVRSLSAGYGGGDYKRATADLGAPLGRGAAARINLMYQDAGTAGRDRVEAKRWAVAPSLAFGLDGATRLYLNYLHVQQDNIPDGGVLTIGLPGYTSPDPAARPWIGAAPRVESENFYGTTGDRDRNHTDSATAIVEHDFGSGVTLRNLTRWSQVTQRYQITSFMADTTRLSTPDPSDPDTWSIARNLNSKDAVNSILTNQTNLRAAFRTGFIAHTVSTGVELIEERQKTWTLAAAGTLPRVSIYDPDPTLSGYSLFRTGGFSRGVTDTAAVYINDTLVLNRFFQISGGVRLDHYRTKYVSVVGADDPPPRSGPAPAPGTVTAISAKDDLISGKVGLVFKPRSNGTVYVSYAVTKQPPGGANFSLAASNTANANNPDVEPQVAKTYEAGTKWDVLSGTLSLSAAAYRTEFSDEITQDADGTFYRTGKKTTQGVELTAVGQITPAWAVNAGFTVMDTKVESPTDTLVAQDGSTELTYTPDKAFAFWSTYELPAHVTLGGGAQYVGKMKRGRDGAVGTPAYADAHWVLNAMASWQASPHLQLQLNAYNLTDEWYVASINKSGYRYFPGAPRSLRVTANLTF